MDGRIEPDACAQQLTCVSFSLSAQRLTNQPDVLQWLIEAANHILGGFMLCAGKVSAALLSQLRTEQKLLRMESMNGKHNSQDHQGYTVSCGLHVYSSIRYQKSMCRKGKVPINSVHGIEYFVSPHL